MKSVLMVLSLIAVLLLLAPLAFAQTSVAVSPVNRTVNIPEQFAVNIVVNNVTDCRGASIKVSFDHNILTYVSAVQGPFLVGAFAPGPLVTVGAQYDVITFDQSILGVTTLSGSGTLVTINFTAKAVGTTPLTFVLADLRSPSGLIPVTTVNGQVVVDPPLPIQLSSFKASPLAGGNSVLLTWKTFSETDNLGFEVQRALAPEGPFTSIEGVFIPGHGTTIEPQDYSYTDTKTEGKAWYYRLKQIDRSGSVNYSEAVQASAVSEVQESEALPIKFSLEQNYPNPFNPRTEVRSQMPEARHVKLAVYDLLGREVAVLVNEHREAGRYQDTFDAADLASGMYLYRLVAGDQTFVKKMIVAK